MAGYAGKGWSLRLRGFVNEAGCGKDTRTQRGVAATTKDAVSAYGRVGVSASPQARKHEWDAQWLNEDLK